MKFTLLSIMIFTVKYEIYRLMCKEEGTFCSDLAHKFRGCLNLWTIPLHYHVQVHLKIKIKQFHPVIKKNNYSNILSYFLDLVQNNKK